MRARLTEMRDAAEKTSFTKDMRAKLARYLDFATLSLERWPLKAIDFDTVADGLISTYRRARQLVPESWPGAEPEHLHDLRRRVVEHRHQMDLIEPLWPRLGKGLGGRGPAPAQSTRRLPGSRGAEQFHGAAPAAGALALAAHAADRGPPRRASQNG